MAKFTVTVTKVVRMTQIIEVEADSKAAAKIEAVALAEDFGEAEAMTDSKGWTAQEVSRRG